MLRNSGTKLYNFIKLIKALIALVGLAPLDNVEPSVGNWGVLAHLKGLIESPHYELVAICNPSIESVRKSIEVHKLLATVKAYGSAEDLANDPDVDLVSSNVAKPYQLAKPALPNKKHVMAEWPLGASLGEAQELTDLARQQDLKTVLESGAVASLSVRKAKKPTNALGLRRLITGTEGEIEVTIPDDNLQMGHAGCAIRLRTDKEEVAQTIRFDEEEPAHVAAVPIPGANMVRVYEAFAISTDVYVDFESFLDTHKLLDDILQASKKI
ncbi:transcription regulator gal80 [Neonectria magnoliae]|uniref:Transcription regulator gal80 n=1 Tax=Neonectria magnoliae TaxID=2732573 RepID=A0ABR1I657_9HYPO